MRVASTRTSCYYSLIDIDSSAIGHFLEHSFLDFVAVAVLVVVAFVALVDER